MNRKKPKSAPNIAVTKHRPAQYPVAEIPLPLDREARTQS